MSTICLHAYHYIPYDLKRINLKRPKNGTNKVGGRREGKVGAKGEGVYGKKNCLFHVSEYSKVEFNK